MCLKREGIRMRTFLWVLMFCGLVAARVQAEPFYAGKPLVHPVIVSQESGATLAFVRESTGVVGYACMCEAPDAVPQVLDNFAGASIDSVFYASLDSDIQTLIVLSKADGRYALHGYRYSERSSRYRKLSSLQPVLDRIASQQKKLNAARVVAELNKLLPYDYGYERAETGIAEFDAVDPTAGTLVGEFSADGVAASEGGEPSEDGVYAAYKKTFLQREGRWLTLTYERTPMEEGELAPGFRVTRITWEFDPKRYEGSEDGLFVQLWDDRVVEQGLMVQGKKTGNWVEYDESVSQSSGAYANGLRQGVWVVNDRHGSSEGLFVDGLSEGRWTVSSFDDDEEFSGFDTYKRGVLDGPAERLRGSKVVWRGEYLSGRKHGHWVSYEGEGRYVSGVMEGAWTLPVDGGRVQTVSFVAGKKDGELREVDGAGVLRLLEHYKAGALDGLRETYAANGKLTYSATYVVGQIKGRALTYSDDGAVLRSDISWLYGDKEGPFLTFHANGQPDRVAIYEKDEPIGHLQGFNESGVLVEDKNYCHVADGKYTRIQPCGLQRNLRGDGVAYYEADYLFGVRQSLRHESYEGRKIEEVLLLADDRVLHNDYYPNGQLKCSEPMQGYRLITVEGREYKDYAYAKRDGEMVCHYSTGVVERRFNFKDGKLIGCYTGYDESGVQNFPPPEGCPPPKPVVFNFGE
jgi:antitoxin component YwqK of YwqJK toxin-antitoxin module